MKLNGRILDSHLVQDKNAREYTKKIYRKHYDKKKEIDAKNELRPTWFHLSFISRDKII